MSRQEQVLAFIRAYTKAHGYPPSMREIGEAVGLTSTSSVHYQLAKLVRSGAIRHDPKRPRALVVLDAP